MSTPVKPALGLPNRIDGIDVSEFQGGGNLPGDPQIDYHAVAAAGFRFAVVRVSLGLSYVDHTAEKHMAGFRAAGMYVMVYGAAVPSKGDPEGQADRLLIGMGDTYTRAFLDLENRQGLSNRQLVEFAERFCDRIDAFGALTCGLYSYPWFESTLQPELGASSLGNRPLWQAFYGGAQPWFPAWGDAPRVPPPWREAAMWQYSGGPTKTSAEGFRVPGVQGPCDRDLFMGDERALRRFLGLPPVPPPPPTEPAPPPSGAAA